MESFIEAVKVKVMVCYPYPAQTDRSGGLYGPSATSDLTFLGEDLMFFPISIERVEVVEHRAMGPLQTLGRDIAEDVQALELSSVAEMQAGPGLRGRPLGLQACRK